MIIAFSQNDVNDINQVLSDESFERNELYVIWNALDNYYYKQLNQENYSKCEKIIETMGKIQNLIQVDLNNE